jgi:ferredoxin
VKLTIDHQSVEIEAGATVLSAARALGIDIPTLCYLEGLPANTSCMACLVRINGKLVPSCATQAAEGMVVESEVDSVREARRVALELLLSDHLGDCIAPCHNACPAQMDIPRMIRQLDQGAVKAALITVKEHIALPGVMGRICSAPCEKGYRRGAYDGPAAICMLERYVADADLASDEPFVPKRKSPSGKHVAIVGAGATGLSAAYYLLQAGHACTLLDKRERPGGTLRHDFSEVVLPEKVLDAEIACIEKLGARFEMNICVGTDPSLTALCQDYDAVLVAAGTLEPGEIDTWGLAGGRHGIQVDRDTLLTSLDGVFAAGNSVRPSKLKVQSLAGGGAAAVSIGQYLDGRTLTSFRKGFSVHMGKLALDDITRLMGEASDSERVSPKGGDADGFVLEEALLEARRCLRCDCAAANDCRLRHYADAYSADTHAYRGERRSVAFLEISPAPSTPRVNHWVRFDVGKCISCGLCIQIAEESGDGLGLAHVGRGFDVRIGAPFNRSMGEGLAQAASRAIEACPTGAIVRVTE